MPMKLLIKISKGINNATSNHPCLWCAINKTLFGKVTECEAAYRINNLVINTDLGKTRPPIFHFIKMRNVIVDVLHMFLRITDRLVLLLHKNLEQMDCTFSTLLKDQNLNFKKLIDLFESLGIKKPYRIEKKDFILRDLNGVDKLKLFEKINLCSLFPDMTNVVEKNKLLRNFYEIIMDVKSDKRTPELEQRTKEWYALLAKLNFTTEITPYCHVFGKHLYEQVEYLASKGISMDRFSMQGLEKQNDFFTQYYHRSTNKRNDYIEQVMKKRSRIEILHFHPDLKGLFAAKKEQAKIDRLAKKQATNIFNEAAEEDESENMLFDTDAV